MRPAAAPADARVNSTPIERAAWVALVATVLLAGAGPAGASADANGTASDIHAPRDVTGRGGFLTGPSAGSPKRIALAYVRQRAPALGLDAGDLAALEPTRSYRSESGAVHLWWEQTYKGIPAFDQGLRANVSADGRLINVSGAARPNLAVASIEPRIGPREALARLARNVSADVLLGPAGPSVGPDRETSFDGGHTASLVLFSDSERVGLAWRVLLRADSQGLYDAVVDATSGQLLYRQNLVRRVTVSALDHYPGAPSGGTPIVRQIPAAWLSGGATVLSGPFAHVYSDPNDIYLATSTPSAADEIQPSAPGAWNHVQTKQATDPPQNCPPDGCTWDSVDGSISWTVNRQQAGTQLFYFVNLFHDHLRDAPGIGFGPTSGNFEGADSVRAQVDVGANLNGGLPDCNHVNNAAMGVPPDGQPALMLTYLWTASCGETGVRDVNGADDAYLVYHEYAHGLSLRLVTDFAGFGALNGVQSGAMGEGLSDWYAMDFLAAAGLQADTAAPAEVRAGIYENSPLRSQGFDCPVGEPTGACPGRPAAGGGGYTYGDFGRIHPGGAEIHADGEIWVETLWDLRSALVATHGPADGINRARALVTDGLRLSPASPTFLDMRNAILQADVNRGFRDCDLIWAAFAARGMGVNARTTGDGDLTPVEDFTAPPPACQRPPGPPSDTTAPVIRGFTMDWRRFAVGGDRTPRVAQRRGGRTPVGSAFRFRLSERARVVIKIERALPGRRVGRRCRPPGRRLRGRRRCTRYERKGSLTRRNRKKGRNLVKFSGRIGSKPLRRGRYRATASATDAAGNRSKRRRASFTTARR
jgi:extracellular elastinolytic metalloproteinase